MTLLDLPVLRLVRIQDAVGHLRETELQCVHQLLTIDGVEDRSSEASIGKYIGDRIYIGYRQRLNPSPNENTVEGHIEYDISRSIAAEGTVGDRTQEISVLWTHDF